MAARHATTPGRPGHCSKLCHQQGGHGAPKVGDGRSSKWPSFSTSPSLHLDSAQLLEVSGACLRSVGAARPVVGLGPKATTHKSSNAKRPTSPTQRPISPTLPSVQRVPRPQQMTTRTQPRTHFRQKLYVYHVQSSAKQAGPSISH